jgi:hypothetical protein
MAGPNVRFLDASDDADPTHLTRPAKGADLSEV